MKQVLCGKGKGFLIDKNELEGKLREKIPMLRNENVFPFILAWGRTDTIRICLCEHDMTKIDEGIFLSITNKTIDEKIIYVSKAKFADMMGVSGKIVDIAMKRKVADNTFRRAGFFNYVTNSKNLYYYISVDDSVEYDYIC